MGPPARILQTASDVVFLYAAGGASTQPAEYRIIPTDGRKFDDGQVAGRASFYGLSVAHWEGDALVVESIAFNDLTWLDKGGLFHSDKLKVTERFTRQGNEMVLRRHRRGSGSPPRAVAHDAAASAAQHEPPGVPARGAAVQGLRPRQHGHADTPLTWRKFEGRRSKFEVNVGADLQVGPRRKSMKRILITFAIAAVAVGWSRCSSRAARATRLAPGAKDKRAVLFNWAWYMGMLRGPQEIEAVVALEQKATGTMQVNGQNCALSNYRVSTNYPNTGQRVQYTCRLPNGQEVKNVEVLSGTSRVG